MLRRSDALSLLVAVGLCWTQPALSISLSDHLVEAERGTAADTAEAAVNAAGEVQVAAKSYPPTLLHFMFLLGDSFPHANVWDLFFSAAPAGTYMAWAHCYVKRNDCKEDPTLSRLKIRLVDRVFSRRGTDLVNPFAAMLKAALPETAHLAAAGVTEKFIVLSESHWPVKPFSLVYQKLAASDESDFCFNCPRQWAGLTVDGVPTVIPKHQEWVVLNRSHAETLANAWTPVHHNHGWNVPLKYGHWKGQNRSVPRGRFEGGAWYTATDEEAVYSILYGPLELPRKGDTTVPWSYFYNRRCNTYVAFPHDLHPDVASPDYPMTEPAKKSSSLLEVDAEASAERIDGTRLTKALVADPGTRLVEVPGVWHPYNIEALGDHSLRLLRDSPYCFARKFPPSVHVWANFSRYILGEDLGHH